jgi:hypothetical protein
MEDDYTPRGAQVEFKVDKVTLENIFLSVLSNTTTTNLQYISGSVFAFHHRHHQNNRPI